MAQTNKAQRCMPAESINDAIREVRQHLVTEAPEVAAAYEANDPAEDLQTLLYLREEARSMFLRGLTAGLVLARRHQ